MIRGLMIAAWCTHVALQRVADQMVFIMALKRIQSPQISL